MKKRFIHRVVLAALACWLAGARPADLFAADEMDATITVTPVAEVSLTLETTYYDFGAIDVNTSTNSATAIRLTNSGDVSVLVDKRITIQSDPGGWTAAVSSGTDMYVLSVATSSTRLSLDSFTAATQFGTEGSISALTGPSGTQPVMPPSGPGSSLDLWFRLDMPTRVTSTAARRITIRFTGTAQ